MPQQQSGYPPLLSPPPPPTGPAANTAPGASGLHYNHFGLPPHAQQQQQGHPFAGVAGFGSSTDTTPPPLTADQSRQSSGIASLNGDAVEGAQAQAPTIGIAGTGRKEF